MHIVSQPLKIDQCHCFMLRKAARRISRFYDGFLQPVGLRLTQYNILAILKEVRESSVNGLAERLDLERTAMGKTLTPLERAGLIKIEPSPTDRRSRIATLTPKGKRVFEHANPLWREAQRQFCVLNGELEMAALRSVLSSLKVDESVASLD